MENGLSLLHIPVLWGYNFKALQGTTRWTYCSKNTRTYWTAQLNTVSLGAKEETS